MKKFSALFILLCLLLTVSSVVNASGVPFTADDNTNTYYNSLTGETILAVYEMGSDGNLVEVPMDVYKQEMQKAELEKARLERDRAFTKSNEFSRFSTIHNSTDSTLSPLGLINHKYYKFDITRSYEHYDHYEQVSQPLSCVYTPCTITIGWTVTKTHSFSANVNTTVKKNVVQAAAGYSYENATSDLATYTFSVPKDKKAYVGFHPKVRTDAGNLEYWHHYINKYTLLSTEYSWVTRPLKDPNGKAAGYFLLIDYDTGLPVT